MTSDKVKINNVIEHTCSFCKKGKITLAWNKREHTCSCGVVYHYIPNKGNTYTPKDQR